MRILPGNSQEYFNEYKELLAIIIRNKKKLLFKTNDETGTLFCVNLFSGALNTEPVTTAFANAIL